MVGFMGVPHYSLRGPKQAELRPPHYPYLPFLTDWGGPRPKFQMETMAMKQGWYWLAAGVLALGLNGAYHDGGAEWAQRIVNRSAAVVALASGHAERFLASAREQTLLCRVATEMARFQTRMARTQTGFAHFDAMTARQEAALARLEGNRARFEAGRARMEGQV